MRRTSVSAWAGLLAVAMLAGGRAAAAAPPDDVPRLDERTALMLGAKRLKLGLLAFEYGVIERVTIGTDPPAWAARAFLPVFIPNFHAKVSLYQRLPVAIAVKAAGYVAALKEEGNASGTMLAVPLSLFASFRLQERIWLHGEGTYNYVRAFGTGALDESGLGGQVAAQAVQLGAMLQLRLTRIFSLTATGRYQVYTGPLAFEGSASIDPYTTVDVNGTAKARVEHPWMAVGGVALLWRYVHLIAGVGYGYYFVPGINIAYPEKTIVPDLSLSVIL